MDHCRWQHITFLIRNANPSYFQKMRFGRPKPYWSWQISYFHRFRSRKSPVNIEKSWFVRPQFVKQLPLLMQFHYGVTTLRNTWIENRGAAKQWNSRQRRNLVDFRDQTSHQRQYFWVFGAMDNFHWQRIILLIRNAKPSYFQTMLFKHPKP